MKIDIHVHTKKVKSGDAPTRNVNAETFGEIIKNTDVKILAITNHNHFDKEQYDEFCAIDSLNCQLWPGIEIDIVENGKRAHLIVICNPAQCSQFDEVVKAMIGSSSPDTFTIGIKELATTFEDLDCVFVAHYFVKKPNLGDAEVELLQSLVKDKRRVLKEATNSISAGIYISHGHNSIYGTDVHDWSDYLRLSSELPELRLPVESFEQFCLLLEKDEAMINTVLNKKEKENIELVPWSAAELIRIDIYNDINVIFGSKGTGKTDILEALSKYYNSRGHQTSVYKSNDQHLNDVFDLKGKNLEFSIEDIGVDSCTSEIHEIKEAIEVAVTSLIKYKQHFAWNESNKISQKLKIKDIAKDEDSHSLRQLDQVLKYKDVFSNFIAFLETNPGVNQFISSEVIDKLHESLENSMNDLQSNTESNFIDTKVRFLLNNIVSTFQDQISQKTGQPPKPLNTGFADYARNRIKLELASKKISLVINSNIEPKIEYAGSLSEKGELYCQTNFNFQNGSLSNSSFNPISNVNKRPQKEFARKLDSIIKHIYNNDLFTKISELNLIEGIETINSTEDLLQFNKHFTLNGVEYRPSNGESSMVLLHRELKEDKDIYLIDEPEKSLGNDYINDIIVPLLKEKAKLGKRIVVATHDANIAVRTLPYNSIYRLHEEGVFYTLTGNPFVDKLKCIHGTKPDLNWKEISMKTLEGGRDAFGERGKIYGN